MKVFRNTLVGPVKFSECFKVGVLGSGPWGQRYIREIRSLNERYNECELSAVSILHDAPYSGARYLKPNDLLKKCIDLKIDALIFATAPQIQSKLAPIVISWGIPVILEKPISINVEDLNNISQVINRNSIVYVNLPYLYDDFILSELGGRISQATGRVEMRVINGNWGPFRPYMSPFDDWAPHCFGVSLELLGPCFEKECSINQNKADGAFVYICDLRHTTGNLSKLVFGNGFSSRISSYELRTSHSETKTSIERDEIFRLKPAKRSSRTPMSVLLRRFITDAQIGNGNIETFSKAIKCTTMYLALAKQC